MTSVCGIICQSVATVFSTGSVPPGVCRVYLRYETLDSVLEGHFVMFYVKLLPERIIFYILENIMGK